MKLNKLYKHKNNTDVALYPIDANYLGHTNYYLVRWFNIVNPSNWFNMGVEDIARISPEEEKDWEVIG